MKKLAVFVMTLLALPVMAGAAQSHSAPDLDPAVIEELGRDFRLMVRVDGLVIGGPSSLVATYMTAGEPFLTESVAFESQAPSAWVELLGFQPDRRERLLSNDARATVEIELPDGSRQAFAPGRLIQDLTDLVKEGEAIALPTHVQTSTVAAGPLFQPDDDLGLAVAASTCDEQCCRDYCSTERDWCEDEMCAPGDEYCLDWCAAQYTQCKDQCDCPTVSETEETDLVNTGGYTGATVCRHDIFYPYTQDVRSLYNVFLGQYRTVTTTTTHHCDGTTTTQTTTTYTQQRTCYEYLAYPCYGGSSSSVLCVK